MYTDCVHLCQEHEESEGIHLLYLLKYASSSDSLLEPTLWIQHSLDGTTVARCLAEEHELEAVGGDECHVFANVLGGGV